LLLKLLTLLCVFFSIHSNATGGSEARLEKVMVQGLSDKNTFAGSHQKFSRSDFHGQYTSLSDFLQQNASVQVRKHGIGNSADLSIRGSNHEQILFMIDGQLIESAQYGGFDIDQIPLSQVESIELIKGHQPYTHQQAIGGVIKINRSASYSDKNELTMSAGQFGQKQVASNHSIIFHGDIFLGFDFSKSENDYATNITSPIDDNNNRNEIQDLNNNHLESYYGQLKWSSEEFSFGRITIGVESRKREKAIPNYFHNSTNNDASYSKDYTNTHLSYDFLSKNLIQFDSNIYYQNNNDRFTDTSRAVALDPQDIKYHHDQLHINQKISYQASNHLVQVDFSNEQQNYRDNHLLTLDEFKCSSIFANCDIKSKRNTLSANLQDNWKLNNTLSISMLAGLSQANYYAEEAQTGVQSKDNTIEISQWGLNLKRSLSKELYTQISINKANRLPTLFELYGDLGAMKGSPSLQPEEAVNISLDLSSRTTPLLSFSLFYRDMVNSIIATYNSQGVGSYGNSQSSKIFGFEASVKKEINNFTLVGFAAIQDSKTQSDIKSFNNKHIPGIYHQSYSLELSYHFDPNHKLKWQSLRDADIYSDESNLNKSDNRNISHIKYLFKNNDFTTQFSINNIFDSSYFDKSNHQAAGRNVSMQFTFSY
jgi:outer membrane cobalamin receptor